MTGICGPLLALFRAYGDRAAMVHGEQSYTYRDLERLTLQWVDRFADEPTTAIGPGQVVGLHADYSPTSVAVLIALLARPTIVALVSDGLSTEKTELYRMAQVQVAITVDEHGEVTVTRVSHSVDHPLLVELQRSKRPGMVLFSSGSTGRNKAVVHDAERLLTKFRTPRRPKVTIPFMLFDHIGGLNTLLHVLSSGGTAVIVPDRRPETVARLIERHRVEVLPASPTFLNLMLRAGVDRFDLSSLEIIAYGAERMAEPTLRRLREALPQVQLVQSYGLSEIGIMRTKSESSDSLWMQLGGDGFETRVRDGLLQVKANTAMLGYLNEASPFTDDGWLKTNDRVEVNGRFFRIVGRASDLIIVGGEKVYPAEVEDRLMMMPGVVDAHVFGEPNAITGHAVSARVHLSTAETRGQFRARMRQALHGRLAEFKIPTRVEVSERPLINARFKRTS